MNINLQTCKIGQKLQTQDNKTLFYIEKGANEVFPHLLIDEFGFIFTYKDNGEYGELSRYNIAKVFPSKKIRMDRDQFDEFSKKSKFYRGKTFKATNYGIIVDEKFVFYPFLDPKLFSMGQVNLKNCKAGRKLKSVDGEILYYCGSNKEARAGHIAVTMDGFAWNYQNNGRFVDLTVSHSDILEVLPEEARPSISEDEFKRLTGKYTKYYGYDFEVVSYGIRVNCNPKFFTFYCFVNPELFSCPKEEEINLLNCVTGQKCQTRDGKTLFFLSPTGGPVLYPYLLITSDGHLYSYQKDGKYLSIKKPSSDDIVKIFPADKSLTTKDQFNSLPKFDLYDGKPFEKVRYGLKINGQFIFYPYLNLDLFTNEIDLSKCKIGQQIKTKNGSLQFYAGRDEDINKNYPNLIINSDGLWSCYNDDGKTNSSGLSCGAPDVCEVFAPPADNLMSKEQFDELKHHDLYYGKKFATTSYGIIQGNVFYFYPFLSPEKFTNEVNLNKCEIGQELRTRDGSIFYYLGKNEGHDSLNFPHIVVDSNALKVVLLCSSGHYYLGHGYSNLDIIEMLPKKDKSLDAEEFSSLKKRVFELYDGQKFTFNEFGIKLDNGDFVFYTYIKLRLFSGEKDNTISDICSAFDKASEDKVVERSPKPCEVTCPKCGSLDIYRQFREAGKKYNQGITRNSNLDKKITENCDYTDGFDDKALKDYIYNHCRTCQFDFETKPIS